jgi:hypothetical protein
MTLPRLYAVSRHWRRWPPVFVLLASVFRHQADGVIAPPVADLPEYED